MDILEVHDKDGNRHIAKSEFELMMKNPELRMILTNFGVDPEDLLSLEDVLFEDREFKDVPSLMDTSAEGEFAAAMEASTCKAERQLKEVSFVEFLERVMRLRGGNRASVRDIVELREYVRKRVDEFESKERNNALSYEGAALPRVESFRESKDISAGCSMRQSSERAVAAVGESTSTGQPAWVSALRDEARNMKKRLADRHRLEESMLARIDELREEVRAVTSRLDILEHPNALAYPFQTVGKADV